MVERGINDAATGFGNALMALWDHYYRPRAVQVIKYQTLLALEMEGKTYGWTVEIQLKTIKRKSHIPKYQHVIKK